MDAHCKRHIKVSGETAQTVLNSMPYHMRNASSSSRSQHNDSKKEVDELCKEYLKKSILLREKQLEKINIEIEFLKRSQQMS